MALSTVIQENIWFKRFLDHLDIVKNCTNSFDKKFYSTFTPYEDLEKKRVHQLNALITLTLKLEPKLSGTVKGKLRLGAKIRVFGMEEGEEFLKASQCYLSTSAGPIAGLLFISTKKVLIPTEKIKRANRSENMNNPAQNLHRNTQGRRLRVLAHGVLEVREGLRES
ncbi:hypothetical protein ACJRO7_008045 [Eucalyptus globulus]|uniref:Uncharacterized protein n=1 Tax=Eucalyptus globulus TaxID=34317 RepID=A0ABD3IQL1_EUCGL